MAPLSQDLAGLILPHNHHGEHLDGRQETIDDDMERQNFSYAGGVLSEIWSSTVIDGYPTVAEYVEPDNDQSNIESSYSEKWRMEHVRESHYLLQV